MAMELILVALLYLLPVTNTLTVHTVNHFPWSNVLLLDTARSLGISYSREEDMKTFLEDNLEEVIILVRCKKMILLNNNNVTVEQGGILTAGSEICSSHCLRYSDKQKQKPRPYLDSSVVIGRGADLLSVVSGDLQTALSEKYLSDAGDVIVDHIGDVITTIDDSNYDNVRILSEESNNTLLIGRGKPAIVLSPEDRIASPARIFSEVGRYVGNVVTRTTCNACTQTPNKETNPTLFIAVHIHEHVPFVMNLLKSLEDMQYDKGKIEVVVLCLVNNQQVKAWSPAGFFSYTLLEKDFDSEDHDSRFYLLELFSESTAEHYVYVDATVHITPQTIPQLLTYNKPIIAPMLTRRDGTAWSNFWGSFTDIWSYKRSSDYDNIFTRTVKGVMSVACVRNMFIAQRSTALHMLEGDVYDNHVESDISFCKTLFEANIPMFVSNVQQYGWLKLPGDARDISLSGEYVEDWNLKYLKSQPLRPEGFTSPCKHVYRTSVFTEHFGSDLISTLDQLGGFHWRPRYHERPGYDLTETNINATLANIILHLTEDLIPHLFPGYTTKGQLYDAWILEVEGTKKARKDTLMEHLAAYHVLVPLNQPQDEKVGGGYFFIRQNCTISDHKSGELFIFPGYITHARHDVAQTEGMHLYMTMSFDSPY